MGRTLFWLALGGCTDADLQTVHAPYTPTDPIGVTSPPFSSYSPTSSPAPTPPEPGPACADVPIRSGAMFDGVSSQITADDPGALGLSAFTLEAWVRRTGYGDEFTSGSGGLYLVPVVGKGRGEDDGSVVDCNYTLGFSGDVLGADFEDLATGGNHPVLGLVRVPWDEWHHVAATYDGSAWALYVDGVVDTISTAAAAPRHDSIQPFAIGTTLDSARNPDGRFAGAIDEVRVWDHARTATEIAQDRFASIASAPGLVGRWALDDGDAGDSAGAHPSTAVGVAPTGGAPLDGGAAPEALSMAPTDGEVAGDAVDLDVIASDPDSGALTVTFYARQVTDDDDFSVVVLPDTQYYTDHNRDTAYFYDDQTSWIVQNREALNIVGVIHNGDITEHGSDTDSEWQRAVDAMSALEVPVDGLPNGIPYGMGVGNHDDTPFNVADGTAKFNEYFGIPRFQGREYYGGHYGSDNDENWFAFEAGGLSLVVVDLQYDDTPNLDAIAWGRRVLEANPRSFGIVNSHYILNADASFGAQGQAIYDGVADAPNTRILTCGHIGNYSHRTDSDHGHEIHSILADYQFYDYHDPPGGGGDGYLRLWQFSPRTGNLHVSTYSPALDLWMADAANEFDLPVDTRSAGGPFTALGAVDPVLDGSATWSYSGLQPASTYEWYAVVSDCVRSVSTPIQRLTTP